TKRSRPLRGGAEISVNSLADAFELRVADAGVERKRQPFARECHRDGEVTRGKAEAAVRGGQVRGLRIVTRRLDAALGEKAREELWLAGSDDVEVPDRFAPFRLLRQAELVEPRERLLVEASRPPTLEIPLVEQRKLLEQNDRLDRVESCCVAHVFVVVLARLTVFAQRPCVCGKPVVIRHERARVSHRAEVLRGIEAVSSGASGVTGADPVPSSSVRLTRVLDYLQTVRLGDAGEVLHVGHLPVEVNRED